MHRLIAASSIFAFILFCTPVHADNAFLASCTGCHGADGVSGMMPDTPSIAGIPAEVQEAALTAYLDGTRKCWVPGIMCSVMSPLSANDIVELSAHFAALPFKASDEEFDPDLAAEGKKLHMESCAMCHGADDSGDGTSSILHGQRIVYLRKVMEQYAASERPQPPMMEEKIVALTPEQIEAILNFYASYRSP